MIVLAEQDPHVMVADHIQVAMRAQLFMVVHGRFSHLYTGVAQY